MIQIPIQPGYVAAIFFIAIDVVSISLVDGVLSRVANAAYYLQIYRGKPIQERSVDLPGITTYLIHRFLAPLNIAILLLKLAIIGVVFFINLNIDSDIIREANCTTRSSTFNFDPSESNLGEADRNVSRRPDFVSTCRDFDPATTNTIHYYKIAFETFYSPVTSELTGELLYNYDINDTSIQCLSSDLVTNSKPHLSVTVLGCSDLIGSFDTQNKCTCSQSVERPFASEEVFTVSEEEKNIDFKGGLSVVELEYFRLANESVKLLWPEYHPAVAHCILLQMGIQDDAGRPSYRTCMIVRQRPHQTLVELWKLEFTSDSTGKFIRNCPGPVFNGSWNVSVLSGIFSMIRHTDASWDVLSKEIVGASARYEERGSEFCAYEEGRVITIVPSSAVIVGGVLLGVSFIALIIVNIIFYKDDRPRVNTIDGISSILREEAAPTNRSLSNGAPVLLGLKLAKGGLRFGPLLTPRQAVPRSIPEVGIY